MFPLHQHIFVVTLDLDQAHGSLDIGHVTFVTCFNNIVLPVADLVLGQGILGLPMQRFDVQPLVDLQVVERFRKVEANSSTLGCRKVFHCME